MAISLSSAAIIEKNKLSNDGAFLVLLKIVIGSTTLRLARNTDDVTWNSQTWTAFPFDLDDVVDDSKGEIPNLNIKVSNVTRAIQFYVEQANGGMGSTVTLYVVHSKHLDIATAELEETFEVVSVSSDAQFVTFGLGMGFPLMARRPEKRMFKNFCPFEYGGIECGISAATKAAHPTCDRTFSDCTTRSNTPRYGGEPAIPGGGLYV